MTAAPLRPNSPDANDVDAVRRYYLRELEPHGLDAREHDVVVMTLEDARSTRSPARSASASER